ncbi:MAG: acetyl-CoA carboxylase biotin carboxyl carrier protein [Acidocella sp.]|nr:acetyl-CoA carboxylase biotin carboxyl carrier protein [Acidocella sp.]
MSLSFDPDALRVLAEILNKSGLSEIELEEGDRKVRLARAVAPLAMMAPAPVAGPQVAVPAPVAAAAPPAVDTIATDLAKHPGLVKSPMVGVAYLSAEPGAAPYVTLGAQVAAGATLLLIEAMKTFNQIKAPQAGTVTRILVAAGAPVEYDEPLLIIE